MASVLRSTLDHWQENKEGDDAMAENLSCKHTYRYLIQSYGCD